MTVDDVADDLYAGDPADFVAVRNRRAAEFRAAEDRASQRAVAALRKPTLVGWAVNQLVRDRPADIDALLDVAAGLREAQETLSGERLRELDRQRQQVIRGLTEHAEKLARRNGHALSEEAVRQVGQTLGAAMADADFAETVRAGRVTAARTHSGFGAIGSSESGDDAGGESAGHTSRRQAAGRAARRAREQAARAADQARRQWEAAEEKSRTATARVTAAQADVDDLREHLSAAESTLAQVLSEAQKLSKEAAQASEELDAADAEVRRLAAEM